MKFEINIGRKHLLYFVVLTTIVGGIGLGVAFNTDPINNPGTPSIMGHSGDEINLTGTTISGDLNMSNYSITNLATPVELQDAVNLETLQAATTGGGEMPLQGNIIFRDNANNNGISTIPLSLPKSGCDVKITVCDYSNNPPLKLIVGADPVSKTVPSKDNSGESCGVDIKDTWQDRYCPGVGDLPCSGYYTCASTTPAYCPQSTDVCITPSKKTSSCGCTQTAPNGYCLSIGSYGNSVGVCCPEGNPIYDATTGRCLKDTSIETKKIGGCSVLSTKLESAFTDVTFANSDGIYLTTADYVAVSYSCPTG